MEKKRAGQVWRPPKAADVNATAAAVDLLGRKPQNIDGVTGSGSFVDANCCIVRNDSGSNKRRGDTLGLTGTFLLSETTREKVWLATDQLSALRPNVILAVLVDPILDGELGVAQLSGLGVAYVTVGATWHRRARPAAGSSALVSDLFGPLEILTTPAGTGERLCNVRIGHAGNRQCFGRATANIGPAVYASNTFTLQSGTVEILDPDYNGGVYSYGGHTLTAWNPECEQLDAGDIVELKPGDDWLPLAIFLCNGTSDSLPSSSDSKPSASESSSDSSASKNSASSESESAESAPTGPCTGSCIYWIPTDATQPYVWVARTSCPAGCSCDIYTTDGGRYGWWSGVGPYDATGYYPGAILGPAPCDA